MKILASLLVVAALTVPVAWEVLWRFDHPLPGDTAASPSGSYIAQARSLPEGSELPYGQGVFLRHRYLPLWAASTMVFAAYCKPDIRLGWPTTKRLTVGCSVAEGTVVLFPPPGDITVVHDGGA